MRLLVLSDIHANLTALDAVLDVALGCTPDAIALLGDYIDYGMRPNEVVERLGNLELPIMCALWGNHEQAVLGGDCVRFSSSRGAECARVTADRLSVESREWLEALPGFRGTQTFDYCGMRFAAVHGTPGDPYWGTISPGAANPDEFEDVDIVLSGHNHVPHAFKLFVTVDDPAQRNKHSVMFINPGSVGQPRDRNSRASFAIWDSEAGVSLVRVSYEIEAEQRLYDGSVDDFYRVRLQRGV